ncbi:MAG TPA: F0F1 ATP synthase subunit B [Thermoleophilaceae bacterium]|nr:F0F1 ATP synthase subunit B [Thermoleophilaceae bacterium]
MLSAITAVTLAATESGGSSSDEGGNFLVTPELGLMLWTLIAFGATLYILGKFVFPRVQDALDKRQKAIEDSIEESERAKAEARQLLEEYRQRLQEARAQAEEIVVRARRAAEESERESLDAAKQQREELLAQTRRDIDAETRRAIQEIRNEVADLTVLATEKVTRKTLSAEDQRRLVQEALGELDFSALGVQDGEAR